MLQDELWSNQGSQKKDRISFQFHLRKKTWFIHEIESKVDTEFHVNCDFVIIIKFLRDHSIQKAFYQLTFLPALRYLTIDYSSTFNRRRRTHIDNSFD